MAAGLKAAVDTLKVLETVVSQSFGPNGLDTVLKTDTGSILVTNCGHAILGTISLSHPVGRLIKCQIVNHIQRTGDNSKMVLMILSRLLHNIHDAISTHSHLDSISPDLCELSRACRSLSVIIQNKDLHFLSTVCGDNSSDSRISQKFKLCIKGLINTSLQGKFPSSVVNILAEKLQEMVLHKNSTKTDFPKHIRQLIMHFDDICIQVHGLSTKSSNVQDGFLLRYDVTGKNKSTALKIPTKFLCIKDDFDFEKMQFSKLYFSLDQLGLKNHIQLRHKFIERFSSSLRKMGIKLILFNSALPDYVHFILKDCFQILQNVDDDDIARICNSLGILPLENVYDVFENEISIHVGEFACTDEIIIGSCKYFRAIPAEKHPSCCYLCLCAPSSGICEQYANAVLNALKVLKMAFSDDAESSKGTLQYTSGAGAFEIFLSSYLDKISTNFTGSIQVLVNSLSQAILTVPENLFRNSNKNKARTWIEIITVIKEAIKDRQTNEIPFLGINGFSGDACKPLDLNIIEPFVSKMLLLDDILQVTEQILRIDSIVPSKCLKLEANDAHKKETDVEHET